MRAATTFVVALLGIGIYLMIGATLGLSATFIGGGMLVIAVLAALTIVMYEGRSEAY